MIATIPSIPNACNCLPNIAKSSPTPLNASPNLTSAIANCSFTFKIFNCFCSWSVKPAFISSCFSLNLPSISKPLRPKSSPAPLKTSANIVCVCFALKLTSSNP